MIHLGAQLPPHVLSYSYLDHGQGPREALETRDPAGYLRSPHLLALEVDLLEL